MKTHTVGVILNGVTGRMGTNQHLIRSILAIREQGGVKIGPDETIVPEPILVGRNANKLKHLSDTYGVEKYTTNLDEALGDDAYSVYFDALSTQLRVPNVLRAIEAGKHVYCEKPTATNTAEAMSLVTAARKAGVKHGVVQDKLWLPGLLKLKFLLDTGFFGRVLSVRGEFGYFVFDGLSQPAQRPSWNYRQEEGGGIFFDMFSHWRYVIGHLFGEVQRVVALGALHIDRRADEQGKPYDATAEDAAYGIFETVDGLPVQFNSSWCTRVRRDDLLTLHVDGTKGSAVAGLRRCWIQSEAATPKPVWNPDVEPKLDYFADWGEVPNNREYDNAFKAQWELFLQHIVKDTPFEWDLMEGAKGVQLAELGLQSWQQRCWVDVPEME
ncbi:MAG: Gfo/Idh/MocA family oxidoreductase [Candidatus Nealsonbacteria bacterium]|nr:Gfo/Idh/MocA family oxidoreductase [Candidatus Nealsonbacteria bacterium]